MTAWPARAAVSARASPTAKASRPTARFVHVLAANTTDATTRRRLLVPGRARSTRSNAVAASTDTPMPTTAGPASAINGGNSTL